ncbi:hypothetical protein HY632_02135 [Candidatus Uhrbacteria bacterium]|nr:hypothetical protein [Candidatus Uhrbacteria bacterium]
MPAPARSRTSPRPVPPSIPPDAFTVSSNALTVGLFALLAAGGLALISSPTHAGFRAPRDPVHAEILTAIEKLNTQIAALAASTTKACTEVAEQCGPLPTAPDDEPVQPPNPYPGNTGDPGMPVRPIVQKVAEPIILRPESVTVPSTHESPYRPPNALPSNTRPMSPAMNPQGPSLSPQ